MSLFLTYTELVDQESKVSGKETSDCFHTYVVGKTETLWAVETGQDSKKKLVEQYIFLLKRLLH